MDGLLLVIGVVMAACAVIGGVIWHLVLSFTGKLDAPPCACQRVITPTSGAAYDSGLAMDELGRIEEMVRRELLVESFDDAAYSKLMAMRFHRDTLEAQNSLTEQGESK